MVEQAAVECISWQVNVLDENVDVIALDCRPLALFPASEAAPLGKAKRSALQDYNNHMGQRQLIVNEVVDRPFFGEWLRNVHSRLQMRQKDKMLVFADTHGRLTAIACLYVVQRCVAKDPAYQIRRAQNITQYRVPGCLFCGACQADPNRIPEIAKERAWTTWQQYAGYK